MRLQSLLRSRGQSPLRGSRDHITHRLVHRGWSPRGVAGYTHAVSLVGSGVGITMVLTGGPFALGIGIGGGLFAVSNLVWLLRLPSPALAAAKRPAELSEPPNV